MPRDHKPLILTIGGYALFLIAVGVVVIDFAFPQLFGRLISPGISRDGKILSSQHLFFFTALWTRFFPMICLLAGLIFLVYAQRVSKHRNQDIQE